MDRYIEVEVANYATGTHLFDYVFTGCEPQINDVIKEGRSEYQIVGREWINGRLCLLVSNAGVVKDKYVRPESSKFPIEV